jgi:putative spermidine/putrescine transport system ATP-binding protein
MDLVELAVDGIGSLYAVGHGVPTGSEAACSVRPDLMAMEPYPAAVDTETAQRANQITARIVSIEMTGYVTRVVLMEEKTGKELLYKAPTTRWETNAFAEGQLVTLHWSDAKCVFLPH